MPLNKDAHTRYRTINSCLRNKKLKYPSLQQLADACSNTVGKEISTSTIEKDLRVMKEDPPRGYAAPIVYSKQNKGYAYGEEGFSIDELNLEEEEWESLAYAANLLYSYKEVPLFRSFKEAIEKIHARFSIPYDHADPDFEAFVQFEQGSSTTGYEWLGDCYKALKQRYLLNIRYENIYKHEIKNYQFQPCLLKEQRNRWYVIGWVEDRNDYLTFALDRILEMKVVEQKQKVRADFDVRYFLSHAVGIMEGDGKPTTVELELLEPLARLVLLDPLHHSQQVLSQNKRGVRIRLEVNINPELKHRLLAFGPECKVKKPASLKQAMTEMLEQTLQHYR